MTTIALPEEVWCLFLKYRIVFLAWVGLSLDSSKMYLFLPWNLLCFQSFLIWLCREQEDEFGAMLVWVLGLPLALSPPVCHWGSCYIYFLTVWLYFVCVCCSCTSQGLFSGAAFCGLFRQLCFVLQFMCCRQYRKINRRDQTVLFMTEY